MEIRVANQRPTIKQTKKKTKIGKDKTPVILV